MIQCGYWQCRKRQLQHKMLHEEGKFFCNDDCYSDQLVHGREEFSENRSLDSPWKKLVLKVVKRDGGPAVACYHD